MISLDLDIKPMSVNVAYQGRRFKTRAAKAYEAAVELMLPKMHDPGPYYRVEYEFYLKNFAMTDSHNLVKLLMDCIVRKGLIVDDRRIVEEVIRKVKAPKDSITLRIFGCARNRHGFCPC